MLLTTPPQLNASNFAGCMALLAPPFLPMDLPGTRAHYNLTATDGLLIYLALYAGDRKKLLNTTWQQPAFERWSEPFWTHEAALATWLRDDESNGQLTPGSVFGAAKRFCRAEHKHQPELCATITTHNVLRALGRPESYVDANGVDYLPPWYKADRAGWAAVAHTLKTKRLISLQVDGQGCGPDASVGWGNCFGEWYHTSGILAFGLHEAALLGAHAGDLASRIVARLNALYSKVIVGHKEDPIKERIDEDAAEVGAAYVALERLDARVTAAMCAGRGGYVATR